MTHIPTGCFLIGVTGPGFPFAVGDIDWTDGETVVLTTYDGATTLAGLSCQSNREPRAEANCTVKPRGLAFEGNSGVCATILKDEWYDESN